MSKKGQKLNPICADRLKSWLDELKKADKKNTQKHIADIIGFTQQYISDVALGKKPMSPELAKRISEDTSLGRSLKYDTEIKIRASYLLGLDDIKTNIEYMDKFTSQCMELEDATMIMLDSALKEVCLTEGIPVPTVDTPEAIFLRLQLQDEALKLVWSYLHRNTTPLWSFIDQH